MGEHAEREAAPTRRTVLVVDDAEANRLLVQRQLRSRYRVLTAGDGSEALRTLADEPVDLVLLDVMMPGRSGYDVCAEIKANHDDGFLPVILLTALNQQDDRNQGLATGADDFLSKPVNVRELRLRVEALLRIREQERTIRRQFAELQRLQTLKDDLISMVVHDLRNPLSGMMGYLQLLERRTRQEAFSPLAPQVRKVMDATLAFRDTLEGLLQVRMLEEGILPIRLKPTPVREVVSQALRSLAGAVEAAGLRLDLSVEPDDPVAGLDRDLVRRALENLLSNAIRYAPRGSSVDTLIVGTAEGVEIRVADRGPGIPDELKPKVFRKFGSVEAKRMGERRGVGLGLYIVNLIMDAHHGRATAEDREGGGTVLSLVFPAAQDAAEA